MATANKPGTTPATPAQPGQGGGQVSTRGSGPLQPTTQNVATRRNEAPAASSNSVAARTPPPTGPRVAPGDARPGQGQPKRPSQMPGGGIKVRATKVCYYDDARRRVGDVFRIRDESEFSDKYMEKVDARQPERTTTGQQVINQQHDEILAGKAIEQNPSLARPTGEQRAITDDDELERDE